MHVRNGSRSIIKTIATLATLVPALALGSGTAILMLGDEPSTISWQGKDTIRVDETDDSEYLLVLDSSPYMITKESDEIVVIDLTGMAEFMTEFDGDLKNDPYGWGKVDTFRETNARETVAGIEGYVYAVTLKNPNGQTEKLEAVLTDHPLAVELMQRYAETLHTTFNINKITELLAELPKDQRGVLRFGRYFQLTSLSGDKPADALFTLPGEPISIGDLL